LTGPTGRSVLLVEDEALIALDVSAMLEELGVIVCGPAYTLNAALKMAETATIDAALLDVNLSRQQVWPAADVLHRRCVPIIFMTGYASFAFPSRFANYPRLEKPVLCERLAAELQLLR
jgi:CheY-like chemotaxis protein